MKKIARILTIRKHKQVTFFDTCEQLGTHSQFMISNTYLNNNSIAIGDIICFESSKTINKKGLPLFEISHIYWINHPVKWISSKGIHTMDSSFKELQISARNSGKEILLWKCQYKLKKEISRILENDNFIEFDCKIIEAKRTSAIRKPLHVSGINTPKDLYLRITMENQLKQACALLLTSVYSISNVFYDKCVSPNIDREVNVLEFVSLEYNEKKLISFIQNIDKLLRQIYMEFNLSNFGYTLPTTLEILDFKLLKRPLDYSKFTNSIIINVPSSSPFVHINSSNERVELQWVVGGKMLGHGYADEFNYNIVSSAVQQQKIQLDISNCNEMDYMKYGVPQTYSFGLGIDQLLYRFYNLEHIISISNPLGIYFD